LKKKEAVSFGLFGGSAHGEKEVVEGVENKLEEILKKLFVYSKDDICRSVLGLFGDETLVHEDLLPWFMKTLSEVFSIRSE
jgi:hypothetical protein